VNNDLFGAEILHHIPAVYLSKHYSWLQLLKSCLECWGVPVCLIC